jgi:hypothetical protein
VQSDVDKYKARLVGKGYSQVEGIDFGEIFSLVSEFTSIRFLLCVVAAFDFELHEAARMICCEGKEGVGMQAKKFPVWVKEITKDVVPKI